MDERNYNAAKTVKAAVATISPQLPGIPAYHTGRSGLAVEVGSVVYDKTKHNNLPAFPVKIDGTVDRHDAEQLAEFFRQLAAAI